VYGSSGACACIVLGSSADGAGPAEASCAPAVAAEVCDDRGIDENCDGRVDEGCDEPLGAEGSEDPDDLPRAPSDDAADPDVSDVPDPPASPVAACSGQLLSFDLAYQAMLTDVTNQDVDDRPFVRYLTLLNRYNAGVCADALDADRSALFKAVNMLSTDALVIRPTPINSDATLYRIDVRDYRWDRGISVDGVNFRDGWEAIIARSPYAVPFEGDEADVLSQQTGTSVPVAYADAFLDVALIGNLYYALIGVNAGRTLEDFRLEELATDVAENVAEQDLVRAGTTASMVSRQDRVVERHAIGVRDGALWQVFDFEDGSQTQSIFETPLSFRPSGTLALFSLPNGLFGFLIANEGGSIVAESNLLTDASQNDFTMRTAVSCSNCHAAGVLPVTDEVRDFVSRNSGDFPGELAAIQAVYPAQTALNAIIASDAADYRAALERTGASAAVDPVAAALSIFDRDVDLARAAGDLGVSSAQLRGALGRLDPALGVLGSGSIDRDDFSDRYAATLCVLQSSSQNQPTAAACQAAGGS
jgi:hypothetical protein